MAGAHNYAAVQYAQPNTQMFYDQNSQAMHQPGAYAPQYQSLIPQYNLTSQMIQQPMLLPIKTNQYNSAFPQLQINSDLEWQIAGNKKRPRSSPDKHLISGKQTKLDDYWLNSPLTTTKNRFDNLSESNDEDKNEENVPKISKPPPIFVAGVKYIQPLT